MSLDIYLMEPVYSANITHNLTTMADAAGIYDQLWKPELNGITNASDLIEPLKDAIKDMEEYPEQFTQFNAPNGWGTYDDFLPWLKFLLVQCETHPNARVEVSR